MYIALLKRFVPDYDQPDNPHVRERCGVVGCVAGIVLNIVLFIVKFLAGTFVGSIAIRGDALNSLTDAGSSLISMISFHLAGKPADRDHPFGHQRIEYLASTLVALIVLVVGYELLTSSIEKIFSPEPLEISWLTIALLIVAILLKLLQRAFYMKLGNHINSSVLIASAADSFSDVLSTGAVLLATIVSSFTGWQLDGYMGVVVALLIFWTGYGIIKDAMNNLLGRAPDGDTIKGIYNYVMSHSAILGIHDLMVHDYGPGQRFASLHAEVDSSADIMESHDLIDNIERGLEEQLGIHTVIHMDPVVTDNDIINELHSYALDQLRGIEPTLSMHDFRAVGGTTHTNLVFDVVVPYECKLSDSEITNAINARFATHTPTLYAVVNFDRAYALLPNRHDN